MNATLIKLPETPVAKQPPKLQAFDVVITTGAGSTQITAIGFTTCDAVVKAIDTFFDGDDEMPVDLLKIEARPASLKKVA